jgi:hypothetical protein
MSDNDVTEEVEEEMTDIVELPAIMKGGKVTIQDLSLKKLSPQELKTLAVVLDGELIWVKRRIVYAELETPFCTHRNCWRPATGALGCEDHPDGK